ncbi:MULTISPECIES: hypothetical protein [unclassified Ensifer]|uniref:hypothetical protein n=1 Tax=unclassified Ensifer TaxID=2633371 RepID=UPI000812CBA9|nr:MULTISPECIES: hypothetical protein [unclassified Ensifer]OCP15271.1 hypothetical protein BC360_16425 [Ensifer sp. LC163]OCP22319.1 hypothetical protein BC363_04945 [Ensifer sp. LC384]OCP27182.1 hypothetical protein BC361_15465 [Ensifer sp. LC54]
MNGSQPATKSHFRPDIDLRASAGGMSNSTRLAACSRLSRHERLEVTRNALEERGTIIARAASIATDTTTAFKRAYGVSPKHRRA